MQRTKEQGITLIALVVTIIVLLILAGVTLALVLGQKGIFGKAEIAVERTNDGQELDQVRLSVLEAKTNYITGDKQKTLREEIEESVGKVYPGSTVEENGTGEDISYTITLPNGHTYLVDGNDNVTRGEDEEQVAGTKLVDMFKAGESCTVENCQDPTHLHIGDYVNYTPNSGKTSVTVGTDKTGYTGVSTIENGATDQTYTLDTSTTWRVLGLSEDGKHVLLTSGSPLRKDGSYPYLILESAAGYYYCEDTLDEICSMYDNPSLTSETARSIKIQDINHALGIIVDEENNIVYKEEDSNKTNLDVVRVMGTAPYQYKINNYAPENYLGVEEKTSQDTVSGDNGKIAYGYTLASFGLDTNSKIYDVLFKGTTQSEGYAKSYWLSSPGILLYSSSVTFAPAFVSNGYVFNGNNIFFDIYGNWTAYSYGVRPVISLKTSVTDLQVSKRTDIMEEPAWTETLNTKVNDGYVRGSQGMITK